MPAFRAGYLATVVLIAALLNLGVFAILIGFLVVMDLYKYRALRGYSWHLALRGTLRENLLDLFLFSVALFATLAFHHGQGIILVSGLMRYQESLLKGLTVTVAKTLILFHVVRAFGDLSLPALPKSVVSRGWSAWETAGFLTLCSALLIPAALLLLPPDVSHLHATLGDVLLPWKW